MDVFAVFGDQGGAEFLEVLAELGHDLVADQCLVRGFFFLV